MGNIDFKKIFDYKDGNLYWKIKPSLAVNVGDKAGTLTSYGYIVVRHKNKKIMAHRVIFQMFHGYIPKEIDHINRIKTDNRIENMKEVNRSENNLNKNAQKNNKIGIKNVSWHKASKKWVVQFKGKYIGCYANLDDAKKVACFLQKNPV